MTSPSPSESIRPLPEGFVAIKNLESHVRIVVRQSDIPENLDWNNPSDSDLSTIRTKARVLKMLKKLDDDQDEDWDPLKNEDHIIKTLQTMEGHEKFVGSVVEDTFSAEGDPMRSWLLLKIVIGANLQTIADNCGNIISKEDLCYIFAQVYESVEFLHKGGIVHGDVGRNNFLLLKDTEGTPQVVMIDYEQTGKSTQDEDRQSDGIGIEKIIGFLIPSYEESQNTFDSSFTRTSIEKAIAISKMKPLGPLEEYNMNKIKEKWYRPIGKDCKLSTGMQDWLNRHLPNGLFTDADIRSSLAVNNPKV